MEFSSKYLLRWATITSDLFIYSNVRLGFCDKWLAWLLPMKISTSTHHVPDWVLGGGFQGSSRVEPTQAVRLGRKRRPPVEPLSSTHFTLSPSLDSSSEGLSVLLDFALESGKMTNKVLIVPLPSLEPWTLPLKQCYAVTVCRSQWIFYQACSSSCFRRQYCHGRRPAECVGVVRLYICIAKCFP